MAGRPPGAGEPESTVDGSDGDAAGPGAVTGPEWWRRRPVQLGIGAGAVLVLVVGVLLARAGPDAVDPVPDLDAVGLPDADDDEDDDTREVEPVEVPEVVGMSVEAATAELAAHGFETRVELVAADGVTPGTVLDQDPPAGTLLEPGDVVVLHVARDPDLEDDVDDAAGDRDDPDQGDAGDAGDDRGAGRNLIAWILGLGPSAPSGPSEFRAYELLRDANCAPVLEQLDTGDINIADGVAEQLYRGAAAACVSALEGMDRWDEAERALDAVDPASPQLLCFERSIHGLLEALVTAHRENPDGEFAAGPADEGRSPCPTLTGLAPAEGPTGTVLELTGTNLHHVGRVEFYRDGIPEDDVRPDDKTADRLRATVPSLDGVSRPSELCVTVVVEGRGWSWDVAGEPFRLVNGETEDAGRAGPCPPPPAD